MTWNAFWLLLLPSSFSGITRVRIGCFCKVTCPTLISFVAWRWWWEWVFMAGWWVRLFDFLWPGTGVTRILREFLKAVLTLSGIPVVWLMRGECLFWALLGIGRRMSSLSEGILSCWRSEEPHERVWISWGECDPVEGPFEVK